MKTFKELCDGKVWRALEAMITGLETQSKRDDFRIHMRTFGETLAFNAWAAHSRSQFIPSRSSICFGCAATCTIQQLTAKNFTPNIDISGRYERARFLDVNTFDLASFEKAVDEMRAGNFVSILDYMGYDISESNKNRIMCIKLWGYLPGLTTEGWQDNLPSYRVVLRYLKYRNI